MQVAAKPLTARQQLAFDYVREHDGVTADEVGAWLHAHRDKRPHGVDVRCDWCAKEGLSVLRSKAVAPLVTYRRGAQGRMYIARDESDRIHVDEITTPTSTVCPTCNGELRINGSACPTCDGNPFYGL